MKFPWHKYEELETSRRNTLQIFITNACNLKCDGCFARNVMGEKHNHMQIEEYQRVVKDFLSKGGRQINLLGGEPLLHPQLKTMLDINRQKSIKTTIYTNGYFLGKFAPEDFRDAKLRASLYCKTGGTKSADSLPKTDIPLEICYMVSKGTTLEELIGTAEQIEAEQKCGVFFISSIRELDNPGKEFFQDTERTMPVLEYKQLVHDFLDRYNGSMEIHVSKRGVFESTKTPADNRCNFANYFIGGKIIQCPYDVVNLKFQGDYSFGQRNCQQSSTCLMSKIILKRKPKKA